MLPVSCGTWAFCLPLAQFELETEGEQVHKKKARRTINTVPKMNESKDKGVPMHACISTVKNVEISHRQS